VEGVPADVFMTGCSHTSRHSSVTLSSCGELFNVGF
jgi:hypothetical protein